MFSGQASCTVAFHNFYHRSLGKGVHKAEAFRMAFYRSKRLDRRNRAFGWSAHTKGVSYLFQPSNLYMVNRSDTVVDMGDHVHTSFGMLLDILLRVGPCNMEWFFRAHRKGACQPEFCTGICYNLHNKDQDTYDHIANLYNNPRRKEVGCALWNIKCVRNVCMAVQGQL